MQNPMTQNQIVSHNFQLLLDALPEKVYQEAAREIIADLETGEFSKFSTTVFSNARAALNNGFAWATSEKGGKYWNSIFNKLPAGLSLA
jgi:hypothetical protein